MIFINSHPLIEVRSPVVSGPLYHSNAQVAKLVDALVSGARAARCGGSNPFLGTSLITKKEVGSVNNHASDFLFMSTLSKFV
jgi:hypothetical protein